MNFGFDDTDDDDEPRRPSKPRKQQSRQQRPAGPKKPKSWIPAPPEDGSEPPALTEPQRDRIAERCMNLAIWHLGQGARTVKQLRDAMAKHDAPEDIIEASLARVIEMGYVNDEQYAEMFVRDRTEFRRQGPRVIRQELRRKGVDEETADLALEAVTPEDEAANARALVDRKLASTKNLDRQKRVNRLVGMLGRKGYGGSIAFQVVREALEAEGDVEDDLTGDFYPEDTTVDEVEIAEEDGPSREDVELAEARALVEKKLPSTVGLDRQKRVNRLVGMLGRKGYGGSIAFQVVREALEAES
jgi:regulatory protein